MAEDLPAHCYHQSPCVNLVAFESVDSGRKFLACAEKVRCYKSFVRCDLDTVTVLCYCGC